MSLQEPSEREEADDADESDGTADERALTLELDGRTVSIDVPPDATRAQAAAIASAVGAHLTDRQRAAAAAASEEETEYADEWTLAGRLAAQGLSRRPRNVERGAEWKAAARSFY